MNWLIYIIVNIAETLLRVFPFPSKTGLIKIGNPGRNSPVLLTCNFHLTIHRVKRSLVGMDAYLLVANSRGINVWCAAAGGHITNHSVVSVIKTSGIEDLVDHRNIVLPQLAAAGIEASVIHKKTGWKVIWGPVYAKDIPVFLRNGFNKTVEMRQVGFPWLQRVELASSWAFPISLLSVGFTALFWREAVLPLGLLIWGLSFLIFMSFPLYGRWLSSESRRVGFVFFDFGWGGFQLILFGAIILGIVAYGLSTGSFTWGFIVRWGFATLVVILMLSLDLMGSTPVCKSGLHRDRLLKVVLDEKRCHGAGFCEQVCPRNCYEVDNARRKAAMPGAERCVQCGACIIQCPFDALCFGSPQGGVIPPGNIRKFKLNMMGKRIVKT
jgi:NAD-dependent dihydropyrimidine dehydrogenase PreA subunit